MDTHKETMEPCYQHEERVCAEEEKSIFTVKGGKRRGVQVYIGTIEEKIHQTLKVILNSTSVLCRKKGWKETYSTEL